MPRAQANGIEIEYATHGNVEEGRPLILMRGLGTQMIQWSPEFCEKLANAAHYLVIFDNRDVGLSTWFDAAGVPGLSEVIEAIKAGETPPIPYGVNDMVDDVVGLMDTLGLATAHIAGISMGGILTSILGYRHPNRVRSLIPIMASTGNPELPSPTPEAARALLEPAPAERAAFIEYHVRTSKVLASPDYPTPDEARIEMAARLYDRAFHPAGTARQYMAIVASGDRRESLARVSAPTLVIHGQSDPLIPIECGRDLAANIPGAELLEIPGMGHDLPVGLFGRLVTAISSHTAKVDGQRS